MIDCWLITGFGQNFRIHAILHSLKESLLQRWKSIRFGKICYVACNRLSKIWLITHALLLNLLIKWEAINDLKHFVGKKFLHWESHWAVNSVSFLTSANAFVAASARANNENSKLNQIIFYVQNWKKKWFGCQNAGCIINFVHLI